MSIVKEKFDSITKTCSRLEILNNLISLPNLYTELDKSAGLGFRYYHKIRHLDYLVVMGYPLFMCGVYSSVRLTKESLYLQLIGSIGEQSKERLRQIGHYSYGYGPASITPQNKSDWILLEFRSYGTWRIGRKSILFKESIGL